MTAKEYIKIVEDKRELLKEIMIEGMKQCDKACWDGYYELYIDFSAEDLDPEWIYWPDCNSSKNTTGSDVWGVLKICPRGSWTDWFLGIDDAAFAAELSAEALISAAMPWLKREGYIYRDGSDDYIEWDHIKLWIDSNPDDPIVIKLREAHNRAVDCDYEETYSAWADHNIEDIMRMFKQMARDEEEQEAERAAWARGEVW